MALKVCIYRFPRSWQARINDPDRTGAYFNHTVVSGATSEEVRALLDVWAQGKEIVVSYFDATHGDGDFAEGTKRAE